jgi:beta-lactamase regulating signal transducer with metallopeptidase domain
MMVTLTYLQSLVPALGWTLAHFLWQGALVAFALQVVLKACRTARARHDWALAALVVMAILPILTFAWLQSGVRIVLVPRGFPGLIPVGQRWETLAVAAWLVGVAVLAVRLAGGFLLVERLRRTAVALPQDWAERCRRLEQQIAAPLCVLFAQSEAVAMPIVAGWLKPMVLIPAGFLTRLPPAELEALILHELAHVRRLDAFANLIQSMVETLLFYHPAVWWVSRRVRLEREKGCDDLAVAAMRDPALYVRALQSLDALRAPPYGVLAASGGDLKGRAARILGMAVAPERPALSRIAAILILTAAAAAMTHSAAVQAKPVAEGASPALVAQSHPTQAPLTPVSADAPIAAPGESPAAPTPEPAANVVLAEAAVPPRLDVAPVAGAPVQPLAIVSAAAPAPPLQLASAGATPAQTLSPLVVQPPNKPPAPDVRIEVDGSHIGYQVWPRDSEVAAFNGQVTLSCRVDVHGLAEHCDVVSESPKDRHFATAALEMRSTLKLAPAQGPDGPIESTMLVGFSFKQPVSECFREPGAAPSFCAGGGHVLLFPGDNATLDSPVWIAAPSFDDLARVYPAKGRGLEGYVAAHCRVERNGALGDCYVMKETPEGRGFLDAATQLKPKFRVDPAMVAKYFRTKVWVDVAIRFSPPSAPRAVTAPTWLSGVDPRVPPKVFPPEAVAAGLTSGRGLTRCHVGQDGVLTACAAEPGDPEDLGFSQAAARLAKGLKLNLWSADAAPVAGGVIEVPIRLNLKGG